MQGFRRGACRILFRGADFKYFAGFNKSLPMDLIFLFKLYIVSVYSLHPHEYNEVTNCCGCLSGVIALVTGANAGLRGKLRVKGRRRGFFSELRYNKALYLMTVPGLVFFLIFSYYPLCGLQIAFRDYNVIDGIWNSPFVGWKNFEFFIHSPFTLELIFNTLFLNILFIVSQLVVSVTISVLLNEVAGKTKRRLLQSSMFFPYFLSWIIVSALVYSILNDKYGALNSLLAGLGLKTTTWYNQPQLWRGILTVISTWQSFGYYVVIYLAAIVSIDREMYESANMDGANKWDEITKITLPQLVPTIVLLLLLALGRIFYGNFGMIYSIVGDNGVILKNTDIIDTYVFRAMRQQGQFSIPTAISLIQSIMGFILVVICNKLAKRYDESAGLF